MRQCRQVIRWVRRRWSERRDRPNGHLVALGGEAGQQAFVGGQVDALDGALQDGKTRGHYYTQGDSNFY